MEIVLQYNNVIDLQGHRKCTMDRFMGTSLKLKHPESPSPSVHSSTNWIDLGQCEIPWADLVIGERIRLGKAPG